MKKIAICRFTPYDANFSKYNIQELGMAKAFCDKGYNVDIIAFKTTGHREYSLYKSGAYEVRCKEIPRKRIFRWGINTSILKKEYWNPYEYIVCFEYMQIMCFLVSMLTHKVVLYSGPYYNLFFLKFISPIFDMFVVRGYNKTLKGNYTKSVLAQKYLEKKGCKNVYTLGVGLDTDQFKRSTGPTEKTKEIVDYMSQNQCLLYVGALSKRKNISFMLDVYNEIAKKEKNIKLILIGRSNLSFIEKVILWKKETYFDRYYHKLPQEIKNGIYRVASLENNQLQYIYPLAKVFLLPSKLEIFGMVLLEALYFGAPVISSYNGGSMTLINGKDTGIMIREFDINSWSDATLSLVKDKTYRDKLVENGKRLIIQEYTWDKIVCRLMNMMNNYNLDKA